MLISAKSIGICYRNRIGTRRLFVWFPFNLDS